MDIHVYSNCLLIEAEEDEILAVKSLPGRQWSEDPEGWIVPITPGLTEALSKIGVNMAGSILEDAEADFIEGLKPQPITLTQAFEMPAGDAITLAVNEHFFVFHHGDANEYARVHAPYKIGE